MNEPIYCSTFDSEGDCYDCGKPRYKGGPCRIYTPITKETKLKNRKRDDVVQAFEDSRNIHQGSILEAAPILGMSTSSLERALYRARKDGYQGQFKAVYRPKTKAVTE